MKRRCVLVLLMLCLVLSLVPVSPVSASETNMDVPRTSDEMRQMVVEYARQLAEAEWTCTQDIDFTNAVSWSPNLFYEAGTVYRGLPYTSDRPSGNANLDEFLASRSGTGEYVGPVSWNEMPGSDCGGQVRLAYAWAGALYQRELEELVFDPGEESENFGLVPLGDYDNSGYSRSSSTKRTVIEPNGEKKMYDCYTQLQAGDCVFVLYDGGGEHIMLITGEPTVARDGNGTIIPTQSMVPVLELTSGIHDKGAYKSNWNDQPYSFAALYEIGFIPLTMETFRQDHFELPALEKVGIDISGDVGFHNLMSGRVVSNYNIFTLTSTITDVSGKVVAQGISYPNSLRADLSELSYGAALMGLAAGDYHITVKAKIGYGEQTVVDTDIRYTGCSSAPVVYISDNGTGNGYSPEAALGNAAGYANVSMTSYKDSALNRALEMLSETGGTVVICDDVTLLSGRALARYTSTISAFSSPAVASEQTVVLTSSYDGVDYRQTKGAELIMQRSGSQAVDLELNIGTVWSDLDFRVDYNYAMLPAITTSTIHAFVSCGGHKTVIEESVTVSLSQAGKALDAQKNAKYYPRLYGGCYNLSTIGTSDLTVFGGSWSTVVGGSHEAYQYGGANITFGGSAVAYDGLYGGGSDNDGALNGDVSLNITGGTISGKLVIGGSGKFLNPGYNISLVVAGKPDLSGVRIINAGGDGTGTSVVMDLGEFRNGGANFTAYYNETEYTKIVPAPDPNTGLGTVIVIVIAAVVVIGAVVMVLVVKKKKTAKAALEKEKEV